MFWCRGVLDAPTGEPTSNFLGDLLGVFSFVLEGRGGGGVRFASDIPKSIGVIVLLYGVPGQQALKTGQVSKSC